MNHARTNTFHDAPSFTPPVRDFRDLPQHATPEECATLAAIQEDADALLVIALGSVFLGVCTLAYVVASIGGVL